MTICASRDFSSAQARRRACGEDSAAPVLTSHLSISCMRNDICISDGLLFIHTHRQCNNHSTNSLCCRRPLFEKF